MLNRCDWCLGHDLYIDYHDLEWGVPCHDDQRLFEFLILEGAQAGLSWLTVLRKRDNYRLSFDHFEVNRIASYDKDKVNQLLQNPGIIRNRLKIESTIQNAQAYLKVMEQYGSFANFLWDFVAGEPIQHRFKSVRELPAEDSISQKLSKELRKRKFNFVGPTIMYAYMQAIGMVNDHLVTCYRHRELGGEV